MSGWLIFFIFICLVVIAIITYRGILHYLEKKGKRIIFPQKIQLVMIIVTCALVIVTAIYTTFTYEMARTMYDASLLENRPYITLDNFDFRGIDDEQKKQVGIEADLHLKNVGKVIGKFRFKSFKMVVNGMSLPDPLPSTLYTWRSDFPQQTYILCLPYRSITEINFSKIFIGAIEYYMEYSLVENIPPFYTAHKKFTFYHYPNRPVETHVEIDEET